MIIIFRWWFFVGIAGLGAGVYGGRELELARHASPEPVPMELAALEAGEMPAQPHIRIGAHVAQFDACLSVSRGSRLEAIYYPITTPGAGPGRRTVVVKSKQFERLDQVPGTQRTVPGLSGILTTAAEVTTKDRDAVLRMVGARDARAVPVLEAHRRPKPELECWIWSIAGGLLLLLAVHLFRVRRRRAREDAALGPD
jgi:hypothetical protein